MTKYRVIHKSLRDFRPLRYNSRDGHAEGEHVNRGRQRETHSKFLSYLTGARYVHPWWRGRCQSCNQVPATHVQRVWQELSVSSRVDISRTCKVEQKLGVSLPLLTWCPSAWPSRLLYDRGLKSQRDLWITLYCLDDRGSLSDREFYFRWYGSVHPVHWVPGHTTVEVQSFPLASAITMVEN